MLNRIRNNYWLYAPIIFIIYVLIAATVILSVPFCLSRQKELVKYEPTGLKNSCLIDAIGFRDALKVHTKLNPNHWSHILIISVKDKGLHVVAVYEWNGTIFAYTAEQGSVALSRNMQHKQEPRQLAENLCWFARQGGVEWECEKGYFVDEK